MPSVESQILEVADRLNSIQRTPLIAFESLMDPGLPDHRIPLATGFEVVFSEQLIGTTNVGVRWVSPPDPNVDYYEFWVQHPGLTAEAPYFVAAASRSPATVTIAADEDSVGIIFLRTVMKSGLKSNILQSPTVTANVEVGEVVLDRFAWVNPTDGDGYKEINPTTSGSTTVTVVSHTGSGMFITVSGLIINDLSGNGAMDTYIDITIDGGTKQSFQVMENTIGSGKYFNTNMIYPWTGGASSITDKDSFMVPVNLTYETSLLVELRTVVGTNFTDGSYAVAAIVHRATLN